MVISDTVSAILKEDTFVSYPNQDLASGLDQCRELPDEAYLKILKKLNDYAEELYTENLNKLSVIIDRITG